jgi:hypothetical protein
MRKFITISILFILLLYLTAELYSFIENKRWNKQIKENADFIATNIKTEELKIFREWNCGTRGQMQLWNNNDLKLNEISIHYYQDIDSTIAFLKENEIQSLDFKLDTINYRIKKFELTKKNNEKIYLYGYDDKWNKILTDTFTDNLFQDKLNPFDLVHKLSTVKLKYKILASSYEKNSEIIKFFLSNQHVLYYIPNLKNAENIKINKLIIIKNKWYFEKLDRPLDNE